MTHITEALNCSSLSSGVLTGRGGCLLGRSGSRLEPDAVDDVVAVGVIAGGTCGCYSCRGIQECMKPTVGRQAEKRGRMQGPRGRTTTPPGTWERSGQQTTGGGSRHWPIGIVNHVRPGNADRCWCRALLGQSGLDPRVQTNGRGCPRFKTRLMRQWWSQATMGWEG